MRFRKKNGKKPAKITLSEGEIFRACREYIERLPMMKNHRLDSIGAIGVPTVLHKTDSLGRKIRTRVEFVQEIHENE